MSLKLPPRQTGPTVWMTYFAGSAKPGVMRDVLRLVDGTSKVWQILARSSWSENNTLLALGHLLRPRGRVVVYTVHRTAPATVCIPETGLVWLMVSVKVAPANDGPTAGDDA